jgi:hypothetical protein
MDCRVEPGNGARSSLPPVRNSRCTRRIDAVGKTDRRAAMIKDLWYKNTIVCCLSVATDMDANGGGVGGLDFLLERSDF